jgi:hypothetical protein
VATIFIPLFFTWLSGNHVRHHGHLEGAENEALHNITPEEKDLI